MFIPWQNTAHPQRLHKALAFLTRTLGLNRTREQELAQAAEIPTAPETLTHPETLSKEEQERLHRLLPLWHVILHNDDETWAPLVVQALQQVVGLPLEQAQAVMLIAHTQGQAIVITCPKERAEHYQAGLHDYCLIVTIEPVA